MKAKTIDNNPHGWDSIIYNDEGKRLGSWIKGFPSKRVVDKCTDLFNSALSSCVAKETAPLLAEIDRLKKEVERLSNMGKKICYKAGRCANTPDGLKCPKDVICPI